jgi:glucokinase
MKSTIGVDIGGSHITVAKVDLESFEIIPESFYRSKVNSFGDTASIINEWACAIKTCFSSEADETQLIGIAMPGPFDYDLGISYIKDQGKYDALFGLNIKELLSEQLQIPAEDITFLNDAASFLLGEIKNERIVSPAVIGITLGTGLGSAYTSKSEVFDAALWNMPFKDGIIEDYISSRWFVNEFQKQTGKEIKDVRELVELYPEASETKVIFETFSNNLTDFLLEFIQQRNAYSIVIGGNISKASGFFLARLENLLYVRMGYKLPIYISRLGENAALIGAASESINHYKNK